MRFLTFAWAPLGLFALACSEQVTNYGPPEGLKGTMLPPMPIPTGTGTSPPPPGTDSGVTPPPPGTDSGTVVVPDGSTPPPADSGAGGPCAVSWSTQIYPSLTGTWGCSSSAACHASGGFAPTMAGTATQVYDTFAAFTPAMTSPGGVNYIVPGNTDPTKSSFVCSVDSTTGATCGNLMPKGLAPLSATDVQMIRTWVTCGAPDN